MKKFLFSLLTFTCMTLTYSCHEGGGSSNPLLDEWDTPFGVPPFDKITPAHYAPAFGAAMREHNEEIDNIVESSEMPDFVNTILAFDNSGGLLDKVGNVFSLVSEADTNEQLQTVKEAISPRLSAHWDGIMLNERLFERIKTVYDQRGSLGLNPAQLRLVEKTYQKFVRAGANLHGQDKQRLKAINEQLALASFRFGNNLLAENARFTMTLTADDMGGIPNTVKQSAGQAAKDMGLKDKYVFNLSRSSMTPFLTFSDRADLRDSIYMAYLQQCNHDDSLDNKQIINDIVRLRTERAHLMGYRSHAEFVLDDHMAKTPANVYALLDGLWPAALRGAQTELEELRAMKSRHKAVNGVDKSDWWYYAEKVRKSRYNVNLDEMSQYFAADNVRAGAFNLANRLYGITFRPVMLPTYNAECTAYEVMDKDGSHLGVLYVDLYERAGRKSAGAWCGNYRDQSYRDGGRVAPVVTIVCNFPRPSDAFPSLLSLDEAKTLFHEFGHALHALFADVPYRGLLDVERDFVELPSQIMENWAMEPEMLRSYAFHYYSGKVIPESFIERIGQSALFNQGFATTELLAASYSDMDIHNISGYEPIDVNAFELDALNLRRGLISEIAPRYRYPYFGHIFDGGYAAGYYSYIWAEVLDKDAFSAFKESGELFNRKLAEKFRQEVLSKGGMADGMVLYRNFRGAEPSRTPLLRARGLAE